MGEKENKGVIKEKVKKKKMSNITKIVIITLSLLVILAASVWGMYTKLRNNIYVETKPEEIESINYKEVEGITNVLLIGTDGRTLDEPARSDAIIIATLDNNNKVIKTTSIMRDTLVDVPGHGEQKINAAFAFGSSNGGGVEGGAKLLIKTIEDNFGVSLNKYAVVNFWGFESIINEIGGIQVDVKDYEINELNKYTGDSTGTKSNLITEPGVQTLNGAQALAYSRIRKVGNGSYERTQRQREVLTKVAEKMKDINPIKYIGVANELSKYVKTNMDIPECLDIAYTISKLPQLKVEQLQIPQNELVIRDGLYKDLGWVLLVDKKQNGKAMDNFIFNNKIPNPEEFDIASVNSLKTKYDSEESTYNKTYGINPADHDNRNKDDEPVISNKKPGNSRNQTSPKNDKIQNGQSSQSSEDVNTSDRGQSSSNNKENSSNENPGGSGSANGQKQSEDNKSNGNQQNSDQQNGGQKINGNTNGNSESTRNNR